MGGTIAIALACLVVLIIVVIGAWRRAGAQKGARDGFYTEHGQEEPTRSHVPYTGTIPFGPWGVRPWAEGASPPRCGAYRRGAEDTGLYGDLGDAFAARAPRCLRCGGAPSYHDSIQRAVPHPFVPGPVGGLPPHEAGPHWEGGFPLLN